VSDNDVREAAFLGRMTAGFTHEMKNVLAIIRESVGLMEDLLLMSKDSGFPHLERFSRAVSTIQAQVRRGVELSTRLNRLAHSPDTPTATVDLNVMVDQLVLLTERFARLKGVALKVVPSSETLHLLTSPVRLQMALLAGLESIWNQMDGGGTLSLCVAKIGANATVSIRWDEAHADSSDLWSRVGASREWEVLRGLVTGLGGEVEWHEPACGLALSFPLSP
jgi:hypothetical protein